jgi:RES domain-containing protein
MICYRVVRRRFADLSGEGARLYGGRYNPPGVSAIYTSQSIALAVLEVLAHLDRPEVPDDYVVMAIQIVSRQVYRPRNVDPADLAAIGRIPASQFRESLFYRPILRVPSVIVPREYNFVLFPEVQGSEASVEWTEPLDFDRRLFSFSGR